MRPDRVQGGGRVEADDEVELLVAQQVEVRGRVDAAVDVAAPVDRQRVVDARDRAGGGDGVGEVGLGGAGAAERHAPPGLVVAGDDPEVGVRAPAARGRRGGSCP